MSRPGKQPVHFVADDRERRGDVLTALRAARLIDHFGSVRSAISASAAEWAELDGIGQETGERVDWGCAKQPWVIWRINGFGSLKLIETWRYYYAFSEKWVSWLPPGCRYWLPLKFGKAS